MATLAIAWFTFSLRDATIALKTATTEAEKSRAEETRILQRAYLSVDVGGIRPYTIGAKRVAFDIIIKNSGNLPATNVGWYINKKFAHTYELTDDDFNICGTEGSVVIPSRGYLRKGGDAPTFDEFDLEVMNLPPSKNGRGPWVYVFGKITYNDGFRDDRYIVFCHRYNLQGRDGYRISARNGRHHEHCNYTDESDPHKT